MIDIVNLWHHYGARPTLSDVSLRVNPGEVVAVMGPNGMGKSTLLAVVAGILPAWKGHVEIDGLKRRSSIDAEKQIRRKVAYLPDTPWLPDQSTPHEFALAVGRLYGVAEDRLFARTDELLESFDLAPSADAPIRNLSTGQRKKVALVATLATEAPVLVLDEPFSGGLDSSALLALQRIIKDLTQRRAATLLMAVPVPELVDVVAQRVAIIKQGRLLACDTPAGLRGSTQTHTLGEALEKLINPERFARMMAGEGERGTT